MLFDESMPRPLRLDLLGHEVTTVRQMGWNGVKNGVLLRLAAAAGFEVLLTCDRNMQRQQNLQDVGLALVVIAVPNTNVETIRPLVPEVLAVLDMNPQPGTVATVGGWRVE